MGFWLSDRAAKKQAARAAEQAWERQRAWETSPQNPPSATYTGGMTPEEQEKIRAEQRERDRVGTAWGLWSDRPRQQATESLRAEIALLKAELAFMIPNPALVDP